MNNKAQFTLVCTCEIVMRTGETLDSSLGDKPCSDISRIVLCPLHDAAPAMYDRHKDNHGMVQEALRFLYEGEYEEVKCLLNHIALNSKKAVKQAEGRHHE